ncbi:MAPK/MAK/MRK overlapping kinase-like [Chrysoperla carnea]|uniref:MAPK/MAK/MRK overlapping kinase-like n=1 Tax=Chrysoperla carnea TaxID=189513 RepID=UPI001D061F9F|nr:MAPK/MAK/MRK overlapping kinase-like [Chrysoperla carnea]
MSSSFTLKYKVLEKIGEGSFSEVLKCQNRVTGEYFAAKRLKKCYRNRQEVYECPEIVAMRKVSRHPNILYIIETHYEHLLGRVTLIFELLDMSIYDYMKIRKRCIPEDRVRNYLYQLLKGLHHLHKNGLFHRDIKPENILIKVEIIKLGDLGSIRGIYSKPPYTEYISTRWYRSPECLLTTGYYGPKMDIWAVGCVYYEMLTLKPLFPGNDEIDQIHKIHQLLGSPPSRILNKFRRHKSRNCDFTFPIIDGYGFNNLLPILSTDGRDILKQMLIYDPDNRANVRLLLEHRYFKELRDNDILWQRRSLSLSKNVTSAMSIGDYVVEKKKGSSEIKNSIEKKSMFSTHSVVIEHESDSRKELQSKSGSINLNRIIKKSNISKPISGIRPALNISRSHLPSNNITSNKYRKVESPLNRAWDIAAKLQIMRNTQKSTYTTGIPKLKLQENTKAHSMEKVQSQGRENYFQILNKIRQPVIKKTSDPGTSKDFEMMSFIGKQFVSKSFVLPHTVQAKEKLTPIREQEKYHPTFDAGSRMKAAENKIVIERPQGRKSTRTQIGAMIK